MSELVREISNTKDLKQALRILLADTVSGSGTIKVKKDSVAGTVKVAEECVLAVGVEGAQSNATATDLLLELLRLEDAVIEYQDIDEAFYPKGLKNTNMPIPMLLASNFSLRPEKSEPQADNKARTTSEFLKVFSDEAALEELSEKLLILSDEILQQDEDLILEKKDKTEEKVPVSGPKDSAGKDEFLASSEITEPAAESESKEAQSEFAEAAVESESKEASSDIPEPVDAENEEPTTLSVELLPDLPSPILSERHNQLVDAPSYGLRPELKSNEFGFPEDDFEKMRRNESDNPSDVIYYIPTDEIKEKEQEPLAQKTSANLKASIHKVQVEEGEAQYQKSRQVLILGFIAACIFGVLVLPLLQVYWSYFDSSHHSGSSTEGRSEMLARLAIERADSDSRLPSLEPRTEPLPAPGAQPRSESLRTTTRESYSSGSNEAPFLLPQGSSGPSGSGSASSPSRPQPSAPLGFAYQKLHLSRAISKGKSLGVDTNAYSAALKSIEQDRHAKKHQAELADKMKAMSKELDAQLAAREPAKEQAFVGMGVGLPGNMPPEGSAEHELYMSTKISSSTPLVIKGLHDSLQKSSPLKTGDRILAIDGVSVDGLSIYEIQTKLSGTTGTEVKITYESADNGVNTVKLICNNKNKL